MTYKELVEKCLKCKRCRLRKTANQVVPGDGNPKADIMFVGEAPGANEDKKGVPFCGAAGKILDEMLNSINLKRKDVFITNIVKCRPPGNRDPFDDEIKACKYWTNEFIKIIRPKIFVLLGRFAMGKFFPKSKISNMHGEVYKKWGRLFLIMYHPAVALYNRNFKEVLMEDIKVLEKLLEGDMSVVKNLDKAKK